MTADQLGPAEPPVLAQALGLERHPEGGWYRQTWRSPATVETPNGMRAAASLIYFLLPAGDQSAWHKVASDEIWLWHGPGTLTLELGGTGAVPATEQQLALGGDLEHGERGQALVPGGVWQRTIPSSADVLVSCLVSPGFSFEDFELEQE